MSDTDGEFVKLQRQFSKLCQWQIQKMKIEHRILMRSIWSTLARVGVLLVLALILEYLLECFFK